MKLINIGFGNMVSASRLIAIVSPESAPIKRIVQEARDKGVLIDATYGRRTRAVLIMDNDHLVLSALFPAYLAALLGLTLFAAMISDVYYILLYHQSPYPVGEGGYRWFTFVYDFQVTFFRDFSAENLGNILLFLPFGVLYPLFRRGSTWKRTLLMGVLTSLLIENIQPLMDRSFDLNDVVLNAVGVAISTFLFYTLRHLLGKQHR